MGLTAQRTYSEVLRAVIAPKLRALGFIGSGNSYLLPDDDRWLLVGFQKNRYSTAESVSFTVNVSAADKRVWAEARATHGWVSARPSGNTASPWNVVLRLGPLAYGYDKWWEVGPDRASEVVASEVLDAIERFGLPWLASSNPLRDIQRR